MVLKMELSCKCNNCKKNITEYEYCFFKGHFCSDGTFDIKEAFCFGCLDKGVN